MHKTNLPEKIKSIVRIKSKQCYKKFKLLSKQKNLQGMSKHFVPLQKEWDNSIYAYNTQTVKILPYTDKLSFNLIKSYLNFYDLKTEKTARSRRARRRWIRSSINKTLLAKLNFKHTGDTVVIIISYYNRRLFYFTEKINNNTIDNTTNTKNYIKFMNNINDKIQKIKTLMLKHNTLISKNANLKSNLLLSNLEKIYLTNLTIKIFQKEINSLLLKQIMFLQKFRINKPYLLPLLRFLESTYEKKVMLNFINVKYIYNSASIISEGIITKLKKRANDPIRVLRNSLNNFNVPHMDRIVLYNDLFNKKRIIQNKIFKQSSFMHNKINVKDNLDEFIYKWKHKLIKNNYTAIDNLNRIIASLKSKHSSGIRYEIAGRLTRRYVAQRAIYKLAYKGNIRNTDSSHRGLSTTLLRGYAKSNVQYKLSKSKRRIGAFGLKTWISSTK